MLNSEQLQQNLNVLSAFKFVLMCLNLQSVKKIAEDCHKNIWRFTEYYRKIIEPKDLMKILDQEFLSLNVKLLREVSEF